MFNNQWNLLALHHAGWADADGSATNEGIRIKAIVDYITAQNENESSDILENLIAKVRNAGDTPDDRDKKAKTSYPKVNDSSSGSSSTASKKGKGRTLTLNTEGSVEEITIKLQ